MALPRRGVATAGMTYFVALSRKGSKVCPLCTTRRMVETAAHLMDHLFPRLPVRQRVLSVPKRLRYFMQRDGTVLNMVLRYCACPPFAMERLRKEGGALVYRCANQRGEPTRDKRGVKADELQFGLVEAAILMRCGMALRLLHAARRTSGC